MNNKIKLLLAVALLCGLAWESMGATSATARERAPKSDQPVSDQDVLAAWEALASIDGKTLLYDKEAATDALRHVHVLEQLPNTEPEAFVALNSIKLTAMVGLGRVDEADALSRQLLRDFPHQPLAYRARLAVAQIRWKPYEMLEAIEQAARNLSRREARGQLSAVLAVDTVTPTMRFLDQAGRHRLAEALLVLDWKAEGDAGLVDSYRKIAIDGRLARGDVAGTRALADEIDTPMALLDLLIVKKYDSLFERGVDRVQRLRQAVDLEGARTGRDFNADPDNATLRLRRVQHLRSIGDEAQALKLTDIYDRDMSVVADAGVDAFWAVNERANSLLKLGRADEAVVLMQRLLTLDMTTYPHLISMDINHAFILNAAGRPSDAYAHAVKLANTAGGHASPYGHMWIWSAAACALAAEGREAEANPWLDKIQAHRTDNMAALSHALICLNRLDEAEAVIIERLSADDPTEMIVVLQDYRDDGSAPASEFSKRIVARQKELAARPAVAAALDKVGRILTLPIVESYWGSF